MIKKIFDKSHALTKQPQKMLPAIDVRGHEALSKYTNQSVELERPCDN